MRIFNPLSFATAHFRTYPEHATARRIGEWLGTIGKGNRSAREAIAVQSVADIYFESMLGLVAALLAARHEVAIELFASRSIEAGFGYSLRSRLLRLFPIVRGDSRQWERCLEPIGTSHGYRSVSWSRPVGDIRARLAAGRVWRSLRSIDDLLGLRCRDIPIGDLVVDTYLRFRPARTVELADPFLRYVIWQAFRDADRALDYFRRRKPRLYLATYTTYVQHGIAVRAALRCGVRVHSFGGLIEIGREATADYPFHTRDPRAYRAAFERLGNGAELMAEAKTQLDRRMSGGVDSATQYMARSAYSSSGAEVPDVAGAVVVFLHDFFDSPHIYPELIFPDFWHWADRTLGVLTEAGHKVLVKPHPNQASGSQPVVEDLLARYPGVGVVPPGVTNTQLAAAGMACGVTMYGTVAHELAYIGVPAIAAGGNPHMDFGFCRTARSLEEYDALLRRAPHLVVEDKDAAQAEVLQFYVAHNLALAPEMLATRAKCLQFWKACHAETADVEELLGMLDGLRSDEGMRRLVEMLGNALDRHGPAL